MNISLTYILLAIEILKFSNNDVCIETSKSRSDLAQCELVDRDCLALAFLLLIGMTLIAEGFGQKIPKGYIYGSMAFSVFVEMVNIGVRRKKSTAPVLLHDRPTAE